jgi:pilus assembly protein Flp/PilA
MSNVFSAARRDELGATAIEYVMIATFVAMVLIAALSLLGGSLSALFSSVSTSV